MSSARVKRPRVWELAIPWWTRGGEVSDIHGNCRLLEEGESARGRSGRGMGGRIWLKRTFGETRLSLSCACEVGARYCGAAGSMRDAAGTVLRRWLWRGGVSTRRACGWRQDVGGGAVGLQRRRGRERVMSMRTGSGLYGAGAAG